MQLHRGNARVGAKEIGDARQLDHMIAGPKVEVAVGVAAERVSASVIIVPLHLSFGPEREAYETVSTEVVHTELTAILAAMLVHRRFFVKSKLFEYLPRAPSLADAMTALRHACPEVSAA